jgi:hypothetical protein
VQGLDGPEFRFSQALDDNLMSKLDSLASLYEHQVKERAPLLPVKILVGIYDTWIRLHSENGSGTNVIERDPTLQSCGKFKGIPLHAVESGQDAGYEFRVVFEGDEL